MDEKNIIFRRFEKQARCQICLKIIDTSIEVHYPNALIYSKYYCFECIEKLTIPLYDCEFCGTTIFGESFKTEEEEHLCKDCFNIIGKEKKGLYQNGISFNINYCDCGEALVRYVDKGSYMFHYCEKCEKRFFLEDS